MKFTRLLALSCMTLLLGAPARAAEPSLPAKHAKANVSCYDCHKNLKPTAAAGAGACMDCHGDGPAVAELTKGLPVNPHKPPPPPHTALDACPVCHRQHQPPVVKCLVCHPKFKFNAI